jgi:hypothetical protein
MAAPAPRRRWDPDAPGTWPARLLGRFGVDSRQFRALVLAGIKLDFRSPSVTGGGASIWQRYTALFFMYLMLGLAFGAVALFTPDVFVSGSLALSVVMVLVASSVLIEFGVVVISPLDYDVLGYQPLSSRTYFAARFANVLFYTGLMTTVLAVLPIGAYFLTRGFNPVLGLAAAAAFYLACVTTTLVMIVAYVAIAQVVHPHALKRALGYLQLTLSFAIYGGYFLLPQIFKPSMLQTLTVRKSGWMLLYPPTWFASYLDLALGHHSLLEILPAAASLVLLALVAWFAAARLSLEYSEVLSRQTAASEGVRKRHRGPRAIGLLSGERRAVALLLRAQFRHDQRFRLAVLSIVPLTAFYLIMGVQQGGFHDPFGGTPSAGDGMLLYFAMLMFPTMLLVNVSRSDAYRAAWVFYVTPARRAELVLAVKDVAIVYLLAPYMVSLALVLGYFYGHVLHAFLHVLVQGLFVNLLLLTVVALHPALPFSMPMQKGQMTGVFLGVVLVGATVQMISTFVLSFAVYPHPVVLAIVIGTLSIAGVSGQHLLRRRLENSSSEMEFQG